MGFFSKKITTDKIIESLMGSFDATYNSLVNGIKEMTEKDKGIITDEQNKELLIVPLLAIMRAVYSAFGETSKTEDIINKFPHAIFDKYFSNTEEKKEFEKLFLKRSPEYSKILNFDNKDWSLQFGQIFCTHFFKKKETGEHTAIIMTVGLIFSQHLIGTKRFLDEIQLNYEIV